MKQSIGLRIKAIRQANKITQEGLAEKCNLSTEAISNIERGVNYPHFDNLVLIAKELNCNLSDILDVENDKNISHKRASEEALLIAKIKSLSDEQLSTALKIISALQK